jgi:two-component system CheB/CheR fusion protein
MLKAPQTKRGKKTVDRSSSGEPFYMVGIGASAGGLDALERFFEAMPDNSGIAFIVVSHLDPTHISIMPELIQRATPMKLFQAEDGVVVERNCVYVAPANRDLAIFHGTIRLIEPVEPHGFRLPIDYFFKSLATDLHDKAICVILSGMASDGSEGLMSVKREAGMVMVQEPSSAKFDGMPSSAIKTGLADYVLPPEKMAAQVLQYIRSPDGAALSVSDIPDGAISDVYHKIFILLRSRTGHDFSMYKQNTIVRRVERRMNVSLLLTLPRYLRFLQENPDEIEALFKELLIGVTSFFRDPDAFITLKKILSSLVRGKPDDGQIRIWVPGCSTGEEAYSVAILLRECLIEANKNISVQIFATDIDNESIEKARNGSYSAIAADVGKERLNRFFSSEGNLYRVRKEIREMLIFAQQSVIKDPPFTKLDMITCRNLLIYFNTELQKKLIPIFHYSLMPQGILFLGSSETISGFVDLFSKVDHKWKIYKRSESIFSTQPFIEFPSMGPAGKPNVLSVKKTAMKNISQLAEKIILQSYAPNCVIVNEKGDIVYIHGRTGKYLELPHGEAKMNIYEMVRKGLQQELPALMRKAVSSKKTQTVMGLKVVSSGRPVTINLTVKQIKVPSEMAGSFLIIFDESASVSTTARSKTTHFTKKSEIIIKELERELKSTKENLRSAIEELGTSNEELKSSNEEMQSTNEEMQSSNEELETSKEELQSLNEELITVNNELQNKNDELSAVNNDMKNLLDSNDIPTIFLDSHLCIKRFNFHATKVVHLIPTDIGRPINHLAAKFLYESLVDDANEVLRTLVYKQVEVHTCDALWYQMRIMPYRTLANVIDGVVITFSDINTLKTKSEEINKLNSEILLARDFAENILDTVRESLLILDADMTVVSANRSFYKMFATVHENTVGRCIYELDEKKWNKPRLRKLLEEIIPKQKKFEDYEFEYDFVHGGRKNLLLNAREVFHAEKGTQLILLAIESKAIN